MIRNNVNEYYVAKWTETAPFINQYYQYYVEYKHHIYMVRNNGNTLKIKRNGPIYKSILRWIQTKQLKHNIYMVRNNVNEY